MTTQDILWKFNEDHIAEATTQQLVDAVLALCSQEHNTGYDWTLVQTLAQRTQLLLSAQDNVYECISIADDNAAGLGFVPDGSIRRHLGYAMAIVSKSAAKLEVIE